MGVLNEKRCKMSKELRGSLNLDRLGKVGTHETLEVEVSKLVLLANLQKRGKLGIGIDLATITGVLKVVSTDIRVDVASDRRTRHLGTLILSEERGELVTNARGLDKTAGGTVSSLALSARAELLNRLELAAPLLLKRAELGLQRRDKGAHLLELSEKLNRLLLNRSLKIINHRGNINRRLYDRSLYDGSVGLYSLSLGRLYGLGGGLNRGILNNGGGSLSLLCLCHIIL